MAIGRADPGDHFVVVVLRPLISAEAVHTLHQAPSLCGGALIFVGFEPPGPALFG